MSSGRGGFRGRGGSSFSQRGGRGGGFGGGKDSFHSGPPAEIIGLFINTLLFIFI